MRTVSVTSESTDPATARSTLRLREAFASADERAARLTEAQTTVAIRERDRPSAGVTLLLDRSPVEIASVLQDAEIELTLDAAQFEALGEGRLRLQREILTGTVGYQGPVRKLLSVYPVLVSLLGEGQRDHPQISGPAGLATPAYEFAEVTPGDFWSIETQGVRKAFGPNEILKGVDVGIPEGMITVILGPSGTGKSVLIKHLIGLMRPDAGDVLVRGERLSGMRLKELLQLRMRCGILFQDGALWGSMNVHDNVALPLRQHTNLSERQISQVVGEQLDRVGLTQAAQRMPSELSGGMRKRAGFARALVIDPEIVFFDEPDSGLDPVRTALLCDLVDNIHSQLGGTYVVITHDIRSARQIADYIVVLWQGVVVAAGLAEHVLASTDPFVRQFLAGDSQGPLGMD